MNFVNSPWIRRRGMCFSQTAGKSVRPAPARNSLQLEWLEDRMVPATVTFAQFIHIGESPQVFTYTNNGGTSADFSTLPAGDPILLSFDTRFAPALTTPRSAHLFLTSHTTAPTVPPLPEDNLTRESFPAITTRSQAPAMSNTIRGERA